MNEKNLVKLAVEGLMHNYLGNVVELQELYSATYAPSIYKGVYLTEHETRIRFIFTDMAVDEGDEDREQARLYTEEF